MRFEIEHLDSYDDAALIAELRRVAELARCDRLSMAQFNAFAKVHASTLQKRFGGWRKALEAAGLGSRADFSNVALSRDQLVHAIRYASDRLGKGTLTLREFEAATGLTGGPIRRVFGSWRAALNATGLSQVPLGKRYTDMQCYENLLTVWTHYGRPPRHGEMNSPPSVVGSKAYVRRWGTWRKALSAFVSYVNGDASTAAEEQAEVEAEPSSGNDRLAEQRPRRREPPLALRFFVLKRDNFRCVTCGASPAMAPGVVLHVDHILAWSRGGDTIESNLRTLCERCNLGKGATDA